tara:strand:- start:152 stop:748 length:597 start_codon:yes stop_codon:yes gene_type:complete
MKATDTISKIKNILGMELSKEVKEVEVKAEEVTLATMNLENGTVIESESFESGKEVFIVTEDDRVPMPIGEYTLEDGRSVVVKEEGLIDSISEATEEVEEEVETSKEDVKAEDLATDYPSKEEFNELKSMVEEMKTNLSEVLGSQKEEIEKLETELSAEPAAQPITHSPESKSKEMEFQISSNRVETSLDRIINKLSK